MLQSVFYGHCGQLLPRLSAKRAAGSRQQYLTDTVSVLPVHRLEDRAVFTVHRQDGHTHFGRKGHDDMSGCHQRLLIGQCDRLAMLYGCNGRPDTNHAHDRRH